MGKTAIWGVIEKNLFRQRVFLMCATNREHASTLTEGAYQLERSGIESGVLREATGLLWFSNVFRGLPSGSPMDRALPRRRATMPNSMATLSFGAWRSMSSPYEIEPYTTNTCYSFPVTEKDEDLQISNRNPETCINCSANGQDHYKKSTPTLGARKSVLTLAARAKFSFEKCGITLESLNGNFQ